MVIPPGLGPGDRGFESRHPDHGSLAETDQRWLEKPERQDRYLRGPPGGYSSMAELVPSKHLTGVRFPVAAPSAVNSTGQRTGLLPRTIRVRIPGDVLCGRDGNRHTWPAQTRPSVSSNLTARTNAGSSNRQDTWFWATAVKVRVLARQPCLCSSPGRAPPS